MAYNCTKATMGQQEIMDILREEEGLTSNEIIKRAPCNATRTYCIIKVLLEQGFVYRKSTGVIGKNGQPIYKLYLKE